MHVKAKKNKMARKKENMYFQFETIYLIYQSFQLLDYTVAPTYKATSSAMQKWPYNRGGLC
jgi:hypothetical protein